MIYDDNKQKMYPLQKTITGKIQIILYIRGNIISDECMLALLSALSYTYTQVYSQPQKNQLNDLGFVVFLKLF